MSNLVVLIVVVVCTTLVGLALYKGRDHGGWEEVGLRPTPKEWRGSSDKHTIGQGTLRTHPAFLCAGQACSVHNPSDHPMRDFPQYWRPDRGLMERVCPCGVGHPDPDHLDWIGRTSGEAFAWSESIHGCCPEAHCQP